MEEFFSTYKNQLLTLFALGIVVLILLVIQLITGSRGKNKIVTNKDYVFVSNQLSTDNGLKSDIPFININAEGITDINNQISSFVYEETIVSKRSVSYEYYYKKNDILSLLLTSKEYLTNGLLALIKYKSFNIDLKNNKVLTKDEVLEKYNIDEYDVYNLENEKMKNFFKAAVKDNYTDGYTNFENYALFHEPDDFNESYYIKENELYYYKDFLLSSILGDEKFFQNKDLFVKIDI